VSEGEVQDDDLRSRLLPGERILWSGQPRQGLLLTGWDIFLVPFSLLWCGFAVFWEAAVLGALNRTGVHSQAPFFFALWGVPFVLAGLYFVFGRFIAEAWIRRRTIYAVTDRRVLILRGGPFNNFLALSMERLPETSLSEKRNGRGTIIFGPNSFIRMRSGISGLSPSLDPTPRFLEIADARSVFDQIQRLAGSKK
jgi:hypothetical protein